MLGSLLGGIASMLTMLIGFRSLLFLTLAIYLAVLLILVTGRGLAATSD
jgi:hypothetical protein